MFALLKRMRRARSAALGKPLTNAEIKSWFNRFSYLLAEIREVLESLEHRTCDAIVDAVWPLIEKAHGPLIEKVYDGKNPLRHLGFIRSPDWESSWQLYLCSARVALVDWMQETEDIPLGDDPWGYPYLRSPKEHVILYAGAAIKGHQALYNALCHINRPSA